jgi:hypothetical protein
MFRKSQANIVPNGEKKLEACELFLYHKSKSQSNLNGTKVYFFGWKGSLLFYKYKFAEKGENLSLLTNANFDIKDKVLVSNDSLFEVVKGKYKFKILEDDTRAKLLEIESSVAN